MGGIEALDKARTTRFALEALVEQGVIPDELRVYMKSKDIGIDITANSTAVDYGSKVFNHSDKNYSEEKIRILSELEGYNYLLLRNSGIKQWPMELNQSKVMVLDLSHNKLHLGLQQFVDPPYDPRKSESNIDVKKDAREGMLPLLKLLDLSDNLLSEIPMGLLTKLKPLRFLRLNNNDFSRDPQGPQSTIILEIKFLECTNCKLEVLPQPIRTGRFSRLTYLNVSNNPSLSVIIETPENHTLSNLTHLNISNCNIDSFQFDKIMKQSHHLVILCANENNLRGTIILGSQSLKTIKMSGNQIEEISIPCVIPRLCYLDISNNQLTSLPEDIFDLAEFLSELTISHNHISYIPSSVSESRLSMLDASYNSITDVNFMSHLGLGSIHTLKLSHNKIQSIPPTAPWITSTALRHLNLSHNQINGVAIPDKCIESWFNLSYLNLENNNLSLLSKTPINKLAQLRELYLSNNLLQELPIKMTDLRGLQRVSLDQTTFKISQLVQLPDVKTWMKNYRVNLTSEYTTIMCVTPETQTLTNGSHRCLYIGNEMIASGRHVLEQFRISNIYKITDSFDLKTHYEGEEFQTENDVFEQIIKSTIPSIRDLLDRNVNVIMYCTAGKNETVAVAAAFMILVLKK
ncbi:Ras-related LRR protein, partial [Acrasis kona]